MIDLKSQLAILACVALLGACQTQDPPPPNVVRPAAPSAQPSTVVTPTAQPPSKMSGWTAAFGDSAGIKHQRPAVIWDYCLKKAGDRWIIEGVDRSCPLHDGEHERLTLDFGRRWIGAYVAIERGNTEHQNLADDFQHQQRNFYCLQPAVGKSHYDAQHNVCVSAFSKTYVQAKEAVGTALSAPIWAVFGHRSYYVEVDREAILAAAASSGAIDEGLQRSKSAVIAEIDKASKASDLTYLKGYAAKILADDWEAAARLDAKLVALQTTEAQQAAAQAAARQKELERQQALQQQQEARDEAARRQETARRRALTEAFRKSLKVGSETHCGLILSVSGPVAVIQAQAQIGQYGMKISQLYPAGLAPCNFFNGVYQDPGLPY